MKKKERGFSPTQEIPTASLADISFLLLIFFLSTCMFALEEGIPLVLPGRSVRIQGVVTGLLRRF